MTKARANRMGWIGVASFIIIACAVSIWLSVRTPVSAQAAVGIPRYAVTFDYESNYHARSSYGNNDTSSGKGQNVTAASVKGDYGANTTIGISLFGTNVSGSATLANGGLICVNTVNISVTGEFADGNIKVTNGVGLTVYESAGKSVTLSDLSDDTYNVTVYLQGKTFSSTYVTCWYSLTCVFGFKIDASAPIISGASISPTGQYTKSEFTVSARDDESGLENLYMKGPNDNAFKAVGTSKHVSASSADGLYSFYAKNKGGLSSATYYVYLDTQNPIGTLFAGAQQVRSGAKVSASYIRYVAADLQAGIQGVYVRKPNTSSYTLVTNGAQYIQDGTYNFYSIDKAQNISAVDVITLDNSEPSGRVVISDSDNRAYFTWDNDTWTATLNGGKYEKNTWISAEGNYTVVLKNAVGKSATYTFAIDHKYIEQENVPPTCTAEGYTVSKCITCGRIKRDITAEALGHNYSTAVTPPNCTDSGTKKYTCNRCGYEFVSEDALPSGHEYVGNLVHAANCTEHGERHFICEKCGYEYDEDIQPCGHNYEITATEQIDGVTRRTYTCTVCGDSYTQDMGNQYEKVSNYVECLFRLYKPYMVWVFIATAGVWSIVLGVMIILAYKNEDKEKAKKMLINYAVGMAIIFGILVACPYLVRGIAYLVT